MKILIGSSAPPDRGSGIGAYAKDLSEAYVQMGIEVHYAAPLPDNWEWVTAHGIKHVPTNLNDDPIDAAQRVIGYAQDCKIDAIINNDNSVLQSIAPGVYCPVITIGHMDRKSVATLACWRPEWSDYIVAISYNMQKRFITRYGVPVSKCPVIYNGVQDRGHDGNFARRDSKMLRILYAGGPSRNKGWNRILSGLENKDKIWQHTELEWYGNIPARIKRRLAHFQNVHYHGRVPRNEFLTSLSKADVLLLPSRYEGCPIVMLEAMSFGVVPIASDGAGAMRWLITSGSEGFICNLKQWPKQMTECLTFLYDHPQALSDMKKATRKRYFTKFQSSLVAARLLKLIERPTVARDRPLKEFTVARWHRPLRPDGKKAPVIDRFNIRFGIIRTAGILKLAH